MFKLSVRLLLLLCVLGVLMADVPLAQESENLVKFRFDINQPIVRHGGFSDWDSRHTAPGAVVFHNDQFHMFRNGYRAWPRPSQVGYLTSDDGLSWTEAREEPVFLHEQIPFKLDLALLTSALPEDDGWTFYFTPFGAPDNREVGVLRATTSTLESSWSMDTEPVLQVGGVDEWDTKFIAITDVVVFDDGTYAMYYAAENSEGATSIGLATSADGIVWTKYDDPTTTEAPYAESDPVLVKALSWEVNIQDPRVEHTPDGWVMLYSSFDGNFRNQGYGMAISDDGIHWERLQQSPVLARAEIALNPWYPELVYHDGVYFFYLEADTFDGGTNIYVSTYEGSLR